MATGADLREDSNRQALDIAAKLYMSIRKQSILLFCILIVCYSFIHQKMGPNQNSRLDLLHSLFVSKTFRIDAYEANTGDKSIINAHFYSDKAPGIAFLALPAFAVSAGILKIFHIGLDSADGWLISSWVTTVGSVGLITALGGVAMFVLLCRLIGQRLAFITIIAVFLGSSPFPYATMLFSHAAVMSLLCIALWALADQTFMARLVPNTTTSANPPVSAIGLKRCILAGLCCGFAIASEYTAAPAAAGVLVIASLTSFKRGLIVALAAIPPLLLILINNWACFGGPLAFGYHHLAEAEFQTMNQGLFGITFPPKADAAYLILFSPERGLFFWTPFYLMAILGIKSFIKAAPRLCWVGYFVIIIHIICISGYFMPSGGWALGPRHLAPMLPFLTLFAAYGLLNFSRIGIMLGYCSLLLTGLATLVDAMPPEGPANPLVDYFLPRVVNGVFAPSLGSQLGASPFISAGLIVLVIFGAYGWAVAFNHEPRASNVAGVSRSLEDAPMQSSK